MRDLGRLVDDMLGRREPPAVMKERACEPGSPRARAASLVGPEPTLRRPPGFVLAPARKLRAGRRPRRSPAAQEKRVQLAGGDRKPAVHHRCLDLVDLVAIAPAGPPEPAAPEQSAGAEKSQHQPPMLVELLLVRLVVSLADSPGLLADQSIARLNDNLLGDQETFDPWQVHIAPAKSVRSVRRYQIQRRR